MAKTDTIQFDTSDSVVGGENVAQAIETDRNVCFNESYTVIGRKFKAKKIYATYDLSIIGDLAADTIEINGDLLVKGNLKADSVRCTRLTCTGKINVNTLVCAEDVFAKNVSVDEVQSQGSVIVSDSLNIYEACDVSRNIIAGEGISGAGELKAENSIAGDYFDFDGDIHCHVIEVSTIDKQQYMHIDETNDKTSYADELGVFLSRFIEENIDQEEEYIMEKMEECAKVQRLSFDEMYYLLCEIDRISYYKKIYNFRDYLLVKYAEELLPEPFREYETLSHVFSTLIEDIDIDELEYSADSIEEFIMSLKIIISLFDNSMDEYAEKVFSFIGLKYSFVKKQFER